MDKKKRPLNPDAAKILEQYRNAGKSPAAATPNGTAAPGPDGVAQPSAPPKPAAPPLAPMRRSGTRGK